MRTIKADKTACLLKDLPKTYPMVYTVHVEDLKHVENSDVGNY